MLMFQIAKLSLTMFLCKYIKFNHTKQNIIYKIILIAYLDCRAL